MHFANGHSGAILDKIIKSGFKIVSLKLTSLSSEKAGEFYAVHKARPFLRGVGGVYEQWPHYCRYS